jgi:hypothetical protein
MEVYLLIPLFGGLLIVTCAWVWLLLCIFRQGVWWGLACLVLPPLALWFAVRAAQQAIGPLVLMVVGGALITGPAFYLLAIPAPIASEKISGQESRLWSLTSTALRSDLVHEWVESRSYFLQVGAVPVIACAWIWLLVRAFRVRRAWGWTSLFLPPVGLAFAARHPRRGAAPLILVILAVLVAAVPAVYILCVRVDLGPRDKNIGGKRHVTLTGWDRDDYSVLRFMPDVSVLQMANSDVTDHALEVLGSMKNLEELDLNGAQVTDTGLGVIRDLPALVTLRVARTKITDKGFRDILSTKDSLMQLDLQHTQVSRDTVKAWRAVKPDRKALQ